MTISEVSKKYGLTQDTQRYYKRVGMIPHVTRTQSRVRDYTEEDARWVELAKCMRSAGLPVEVMIEYLKLTQAGDTTIPARRELLTEQREVLIAQREAINNTLERLNYKIARNDQAMKTGVLSWDKPEV